MCQNEGFKNIHSQNQQVQWTAWTRSNKGPVVPIYEVYGSSNLPLELGNKFSKGSLIQTLLKKSFFQERGKMTESQDSLIDTVIWNPTKLLTLILCCIRMQSVFDTKSRLDWILTHKAKDVRNRLNTITNWSKIHQNEILVQIVVSFLVTSRSVKVM